MKTEAPKPQNAAVSGVYGLILAYLAVLWDQFLECPSGSSVPAPWLLEGCSDSGGRTLLNSLRSNNSKAIQLDAKSGA